MAVVKQFDLKDIKKKLQKIYRANDLENLVTENRFIAVFMERHKNWIRGEKLLIHNGWYKDFEIGILNEYEMLWNDPEMQQIL